MVSRQRVFSLLLAAMVSVLAGCQGGSTVDVHNQPPPPGSSLAIKVQTTPDTGTILINSTATLVATVTGDTGSVNAGVDWSLTCQSSGKCGTLSALHTASAQSVTYTPPSTLSGNSQTVNIVAFATADHSQNFPAPIVITAFGSSLQGAYVFQAKGSDVNLLPYRLAGVIVLDGNGNITSGTQTLNSISGTITTSILAGSSYFIGGDERGTITLNTTDTSSQPLVEHFSLVVLSASQALIAENDPPQSSSGTMDLQTSTAFPTGGYAFAMSGIDAGGTPAVFGGIVNIDNNPSPGSISGKGSVADQDYTGFLASCSTPSAFSGSSVSQPDPNQPDLVVFSLSAVNQTTGLPCLGIGSITVNGYIIDATHIALIETDGGFLTAGIAIAQGPATGTFNLASFSGTYVFGLLGIDMSNLYPSSFTSVGLVVPDGAGNLTTGFMDTFLATNCVQSTCTIGGITGGQISAQFDGTYSIDSKGIGRVRSTFKNFNPPPRPNFRPAFIFYLTGNGNPPLVLDAGGEDINYPSLGTGIAYPRTATNLTLNGKYGISFTQQNGGNSENDGTGQFTADATANPSISGLVDDIVGAGVPATLNDSFGSPDSNGRIAGTFLGAKGEYYPVDSTHGFFVETDLLDPQALLPQVTLGYYAPRTPLCSGCP